MPTHQCPPPFSLDCLMDFPPAPAQASTPNPASSPAAPMKTQPETNLQTSNHIPSLPKTATPPNTSPNEPGLWRKTLFPDMKHPKNFRLRFIPPAVRNDKPTGVCQKSAIEGELVILDLTLVGFFLGRRPSYTAVRSSLLKQWKIQGNVEIIQMLQGGYAFRFSNVRDRDNILEGDSYFVGGQPIFLRAWDRSLHSGGILGLRNIPLWVSLPGLPLHLWGEEGLSTVCSVLGVPLYADRNTATKARLAFARVCVEFMGNKPLLDSISIEDDLGMTYEQKVVYEWKPPHCISCGVFGHEECVANNHNSEMKSDSIQLEMLDEDENLITGQQLLQKDRQIPMTLGRNFHEEMREEEAEAGWEDVRVKKKKSDRIGSAKTGQNRPDGQHFNAGQRVVSHPHWRRLGPSAGQVRKPVSLPKMGDFLKFKFCPSTESGPSSISGKTSVSKDYATPPSEPLESPKTAEVIQTGPTNTGSSAGHTPYPNRLGSLARDLRCRLPSKHAVQYTVGSKPIEGTPQNQNYKLMSESLTMKESSRQDKNPLLEPGNYDDNGKNKEGIEENVEIPKVLSNEQVNSEGYRKEDGLETTGMYETRISNKRRLFGGAQVSDQLGHDMAENL